MNIRPALLLLLLLAAPAPSWAQQEPLGRLFLTPQQRAALDRQRLLNPGFSPNATEGEASQTINGEVRRSHGHATRWINGQAVWDDSVPVPRVPVGDTFHPETGERESLLGGGRIIIKHPRTGRQNP
jgi:hypothetical protein